MVKTGEVKGDFDAHVRVTTEVDGFMERYGSVFKDGKVLVVKEKEGTPEQHYHAYVSGINYHTLCGRLKKYFSGNKQYSCRKVQNPDMQRRYLCKGTEVCKPLVICNSLGVDVDEGYRKFWSDREEYKAKVKAKVKSDAEFKRQLLQCVLDTKGQMEQHQYLSIRNIFDVCIALCREMGKLPPGDYLMIQYIEYVKMMCGDNLEDKYRRILTKMVNDGFEVL